MVFSRISKASLVAMVLIILTAFDRVNAAPMFPLPGWTREAEEARHFQAKPLNLDLNLSPPKEGVEDLDPPTGFHVSSTNAIHQFQPETSFERTSGDAGPSHPTSYAQSTGIQPWQVPNNHEWGQNVGYGMPRFGPSYSATYKHPGVPNWQAAGHNVGYVGPSYGPSRGNLFGNNDHHALTSSDSDVTMPLDAPARKAASPGTPVAGEPWSDDDILNILHGNEWRGLDHERKSALLNLWGVSVFSPERFKSRNPMPGHRYVFSDGSQLQRKLIEEFMNLRLEDEMSLKLKPIIPNMSQKRLKFHWDPKATPESPRFFENAVHRVQKLPSPSHEAATSTVDDLPKGDPFRPFILGGFNVKLSLEGDIKRGATALHRLNKGFPGGGFSVNVNVLAISLQDRERQMYLGKANIWLAPKDGAEPM